MPRQSTGSDFPRKTGLWAVQITKNGKYITQYAKSQAEAELLRQKLLAESFDRAIITPAVPPVTASKPTITGFLQQYLQRVTLVLDQLQPQKFCKSSSIISSFAIGFRLRRHSQPLVRMR